MATGVGGTSIKGSDVFYDFYCTVCEEKGRHVEAIKRCEDCNEDMCGDCLDNHNMFKAMREHSLVDKQDVGKSLQDGGRPNLPRVKCNEHPRNIVELYCGNHDNVGCATCGNIDHKLCKDMHYVPDVAAGIKTTSEPRDVADSLATLVNRTAQVNQDKKEDLRHIITQRDTAVQNIEQRVDDIKQKLDDLKEAAIAELDATFRELKKTTESDIDRSRGLTGQLEKFERQLRAVQNVGESDLFVYVKQGRSKMKEGEKIVQELEKSRGESFHVVIDDTVLACVTGLAKFAKIDRPTELDLSVEQMPTVKMDSDQNKCLITDCCFLDNGTMLISDENNKSVKLFDKAYKALDRCAVQSRPTAVCVVGIGEVAMTLFEKEAVQFATVDRKIRLTRSFSVGERCRGASYSNNRLFISCGGGGREGPSQVRIYDTNGDLLQTINHDNLARPLHNTTTRNGGCIVANRERGVLAFDNEGKIVWKLQHADLKHVIGVCEVDDRVLVCCWENGHVFQVNPTDQRRSRILLHGSIELKEPRSLTYDMRNDKILVTKEPCDNILVYKIVRK